MFTHPLLVNSNFIYTILYINANPTELVKAQQLVRLEPSDRWFETRWR